MGFCIKVSGKGKEADQLINSTEPSEQMRVPSSLCWMKASRITWRLVKYTLPNKTKEHLSFNHHKLTATQGDHLLLLRLQSGANNKLDALIPLVGLYYIELPITPWSKVVRWILCTKHTLSPWGKKNLFCSLMRLEFGKVPVMSGDCQSGSVISKVG